MSDAPGDTLAEIRLKAMNLLARREHSRAELSDKLGRRFDGADEAIEQVLEQLAEEGLQSDERFSEAYVASRERQGKGPLRIAQELGQKGVASELFEPFLEEGHSRWWELALSVRIKRFGEAPAESAKERARQARFLQYRGFSPDQARAAIASDPTHP